jgi:hypothetical protein
MDIYGHLFDSSAERTADAMEEMFVAAQASSRPAKITRLPARNTRNPSKHA